MASPTARTMAWLRKQGYVCAVVEQRIPTLEHVTRDFCGFADIIAFNHTHTIAVQATSASNIRSRERKIWNEPRALAWALGKGRQVWVVGWKKYAKAIGRRHWLETVLVVQVDAFTKEIWTEAEKLLATSASPA